MKNFSYLLLILALSGCVSKNIRIEDIPPLEKNKEFEKLVKITPGPEPEPVIESKPDEKKQEGSGAVIQAPPKEASKKVAPKKVAVEKKVDPKKKTMKREPDLEDSEGWDGRRPMVDPFRVGEKVVLDVTYLNMRAGIMTIETLPFSDVNGRKSYRFRVKLQTSPTFSNIYSVDDSAETFVDFENMIPTTHLVSIKESKQFGEIRSFFDWKTNTARWWQTKVTDKGKQEKKHEWKMLPFSQNVISAAFYLRTFTLTTGKKLAFRVADEGENIIFRGEVVRREMISTPAGKFKTVVVRPSITVDGAFRQMGEILFYLTDDDRKLIVRIESKIKIGTLIGKLQKIEYGQP